MLYQHLTWNEWGSHYIKVSDSLLKILTRQCLCLYAASEKQDLQKLVCEVDCLSNVIFQYYLMSHNMNDSKEFWT